MSPLHPDLAIEEGRNLGRAASDLAIAAWQECNAEDALRILGRTLEGTDAERGMPTDEQMSDALLAVGALSMATLHRTEATRRYLALRDRVRGPAPE